MTIDITINGHSITVDASATLADVAREHGVDESASGVAIAVNDTVVPKREWMARRVLAGDTVEIIHAVQGG
jgi:sulfur carrier protein